MWTAPYRVKWPDNLSQLIVFVIGSVYNSVQLYHFYITRLEVEAKKPQFEAAGGAEAVKIVTAPRKVLVLVLEP